MLRYVLQTSASPPKSYIRGKLGVEDFAVSYPPNGVIPFHGFTMYGESGFLPTISNHYVALEFGHVEQSSIKVSSI